MPEICEYWPGLVKSCVYYVHQTREIYKVLPYSEELWNPLSKTVIGKFSSSVIRGNSKYGMFPKFRYSMIIIKSGPVK